MSESSAFPMHRLCDIGVILYDCLHKTPNPVSSGYPYIAIPDIQQGTLKLDNVRLISSEDYHEWTKKTKPKEGDIILTRRGRVGDTAQIPPNLDCAIGQNLVILRSSGEKVDQGYLRWALTGPRYRQEVQKYLNVGAVFDSLNCRDIPLFEIPLPPLPEQKAIAHILSTLDEKIELNRKMNKTLEEIGKAIFKRWFVDFEFPDEEGKPYKSSGGEMVFNEELGKKIPVGWKVGTLEEVATIIDCMHSKKPEQQNNGKLVLQVYNIGQTGLLDLSNKFYVTDEDYEKWIKRIEVSEGDMIISKTGRVGAIAQIPSGVKAALGRNLVGVRPNNAMISTTYLKQYFLSRHMINEISMKTLAGTVMHSLHVKEIEKLRIIIPSINIIYKFDYRLKPIHERLNVQSNDRICDIRDMLLPNLISGKIRINVEDDT